MEIVGKQREVLALPMQGCTVVLGSAGSGKTTLALLRAMHLSLLPGSPEVLLATFNSALAAHLQTLASHAPSNLTVRHYHRFAREYLLRRGRISPQNGILSDRRRGWLLRKALGELRRAHPQEAALQQPEADFLKAVSQMLRRGLDWEADPWVLALYRRYCRLRGENCYDWEDLAEGVRAELAQDPEKPFAHIVVDEGQDFSPAMLRSLLAAREPEGSFSFFGDLAQQIYDPRLSWREALGEPDRVWRLSVNYRNPQPVAALAKAITESPLWHGDPDMVPAAGSDRPGPNPRLVRFPDARQEAAWVAEQAAAGEGSAAILLPSQWELEPFRPLLTKLGCAFTEIDRRTPGLASEPRVYLTTVYGAKGLEFDRVYLPFLGETWGAKGEEPARLFYVAVTRCRRELVMSCTGEPSPLLPAHEVGP